jgi:hypothetical protein
MTAMESPEGRDSLDLLWQVNPIDRESLWQQFGRGQVHLPPWLAEPSGTMADHRPPLDPPQCGPALELPRNLLEYTDKAPFPWGKISGVSQPELSAITTVLGVQFIDMNNPYRIHRGYASPRALYPVELFFSAERRWHLLDPENHRMQPLRDAQPALGRTQLLLSGRYLRIPRAYRFFRSSLVNLELGIMLRALCLGFALFDVRAHLQLPGLAAEGSLAALGLTPRSEWSLPVMIDCGPPPIIRPVADLPAEPLPEPLPAEILRINRAQDPPPGATVLSSGIPESVPTGGSSWAEVLWHRHSGRMPRGLLGMSARPVQLPQSVLATALAWISQPPPGPSLRAVWDCFTISVAVHGISGKDSGIYRLSQGELIRQRRDPQVMRALEADYGYPVSRESGCDIRHAAMVWLVSISPQRLHQHCGESGWTWAQYAAGWAIHGVTLAAAQAGLFARPVRAFDEPQTQRIFELPLTEMISIAAIIGQSRYSSPDIVDVRL